MKRPVVEVERGFVIVRKDGRLAERFLYRSEDAALAVASVLFPDCTVKPARSVSCLRKATTTTLRPWSDIIIDEASE